MKHYSQRLLWIGLGAAVLFGAIWQFYPLSDAQGRFARLPMNGATFRGFTVPPSDFEKGFFKDVNLLKRIYVVDGQKAFLNVLDGTHNRHAVHDPYYCFRGGGWQLIEEENFPMPGGTAKLIRMRKGREYKEAMVWFSDGKTRHTSAFWYFLQATLRRLTLGYSGEEPILIVLRPMDTDLFNWEAFVEGIPPLSEL